MRSYFFITLFILPFFLSAQQNNTSFKSQERPKLVVGLVIDQMRWDYLYRYADRYGKGGFKRLLKEGFSCENSYISYIPSYTACGHSSVYTGSVPAINGITGNDWIEQYNGKEMYCTADSTVQTVGSSSNAGEMSPKNLLTTTIGDELRLATNFRSKVIGIALKDRGGILPAGHTANAAYWFDDLSGSWISSTFYMKELPKWVKSFNDQKLPEKYLKQTWNTLFPIETYIQSSVDNSPFEGKFVGENAPVFPHGNFRPKGKDFSNIRTTPFGNTLTFDFAKRIISEEQMGKDEITDLLAVSLSATDYIGHQFGPNSIEVEDTYLRLDLEIENFLNYLDDNVGKGDYTFFLTADHGGAHNANFLLANKISGGFWDAKPLSKELNQVVENKYKVKGLIRSIYNYQVNFNYDLIEKHNINLDNLKKDCISFLRRQPGISFVVDMEKVNDTSVPETIKEKIINGYNHKRSGEIVMILEPGWYQAYGLTGTSHGTWNPYDTHIPMIFMGKGINKGVKLNRHTSMSDIAPTISALLNIQEPNGSIGKPVSEAFSK